MMRRNWFGTSATKYRFISDFSIHVIWQTDAALWYYPDLMEKFSIIFDVVNYIFIRKRTSIQGDVHISAIDCDLWVEKISQAIGMGMLDFGRFTKWDQFPRKIKRMTDQWNQFQSYYVDVIYVLIEVYHFYSLFPDTGPHFERIPEWPYLQYCSSSIQFYRQFEYEDSDEIAQKTICHQHLQKEGNKGTCIFLFSMLYPNEKINISSRKKKSCVQRLFDFIWNGSIEKK